MKKIHRLCLFLNKKKKKMDRKSKEPIYIYQWKVEDVQEIDQLNSIRVRGYGYNQKNQQVYIELKENYFKPWLSLEITKPTSRFEIIEKLKRVNQNIQYIDEDVKEKSLENNLPFIYICKSKLKNKLYFYSKNQLVSYTIKFNSQKLRRTFCKLLRLKFPVEKDTTFFKVHEDLANPLLQFLTENNLPSTGWIYLTNVVNNPACYRENKRATHLLPKEMSIFEYYVTPNQLQMVVNQEQYQLPNFSVLSFDFEAYSEAETRMPIATEKNDCIFQIGISFHSTKNNRSNYLLTLSKKKFRMKDVTVKTFLSEEDLLQYFYEMIVAFSPAVIMGYNIFSFDLPYLHERCQRYKIEIEKAGLVSERRAQYLEIKWTSSAYANQEFHYYDWCGRIVIDLLPVIKREHKLANYKLKTVSSYFLKGDTKDPVTVQQIFSGYREGFLGSDINLLARVGKYCVKDASLVLDLYQKLNTMIGLIELARLCNVNIMDLFVRGQQIKVYSQIYRHCYETNRLVDSFQNMDESLTPMFESDKYQGAYVFPPKPGLYQNVLPFDFTSLYPTTMVSMNIDYSTLVIDESVTDDQCNVIEWVDEDTKQPYKFRFIKQPLGVIPTLLKRLLEERKHTKTLLKKEKQDLLRLVLDKRQLSLKISANSMYGIFGTTKGMLPFLPGAQSTTARGRASIIAASKYVQSKYNAHVVYGDTDSIYCQFPNVKNAKSAWLLAKEIEKHLYDIEFFPRPMALLFEEHLYREFLILTKKRYMAYSQNEDGSMDKDLTIRGVVLARRDNSAWVRVLYERTVRQMMNHDSFNTVLDSLNSYFLDLFQWSVSTSDINLFVVTKQLGSNYKIKPLLVDVEKTTNRFLELQIQNKIQSKSQILEMNTQIENFDPKQKIPWLHEYVEKTRPAHCQLAQRMEARGNPISVGTRMEYVVISDMQDDPNGKLSTKLEDPNYFCHHADILRIDRLYYLKSTVMIIDQLINVVFKKTKVVETIYNHHKRHYLVMKEIRKNNKAIIQMLKC